MKDNGGRRIGMDRRQYSYTGHIPERRVNPDRRSGVDRRSGQERRKKTALGENDGLQNGKFNSTLQWGGEERRKRIERRAAFI